MEQKLKLWYEKPEMMVSIQFDSLLSTDGTVQISEKEIRVIDASSIVLAFSAVKEPVYAQVQWVCSMEKTEGTTDALHGHEGLSQEDLKWISI